MSTIRKFGLAAGAAIMLFSTGALAEGDPAKGEKVFKKCVSCHTLEEGKHKVGPSLAGIVGRMAGTADGYKYSAINLAAAEADLVWDEATIIGYLENPQKFLEKYLADAGVELPKKKKTKMAYKLKKEDQRADVTAYLMSLSN